MARSRALDGSSSRSFVLACLVLIFISLCLIAYSARNPEVTEIGARAAQEVSSPIQESISSSVDFFSSLMGKYQALVEAREQNESLKNRIAVLETENSRLREFEVENKRLAELLHFSENQKLNGIAARVIGHDAVNWVESVIVDAGLANGVKRGMPAVDGSGGVVGRIVSVTSGAAQVLLITDRSSGVDVLLQDSRARGILRGADKNLCELSFVDSEAQVAVGDRVITSGMDGIYPKGLTIGVVSAAEKDPRGMFQKVQITPQVQFKRLEEVLVIANPQIEVPKP